MDSLIKKKQQKSHNLKQILSHSAGWKPYITHQNLVYNKKGNYKWNTLSHSKSKRFPHPVSDSLFVHKRYQKKIFRRIKKTELTPLGELVYSGMFYFFMPQLVPRLSGLSFSEFLNTHFFKPMELERITFLPTEKFPKSEIVPTERDSLFRKQLIHGWVHGRSRFFDGGHFGKCRPFCQYDFFSSFITNVTSRGKLQRHTVFKA